MRCSLDAGTWSGLPGHVLKHLPCLHCLCLFSDETVILDFHSVILMQTVRTGSVKNSILDRFLLDIRGLYPPPLMQYVFLTTGLIWTGPHRLDLGDVLYAPNTLQTPDGRTLLLAWLQELRKGGGFDYAGCLSLPRELSLQGAQSSLGPITWLQNASP